MPFERRSTQLRGAIWSDSSDQVRAGQAGSQQRHRCLAHTSTAGRSASGRARTTTPRERQASIYAAIIQALAPDTPGDPGAEPEEFDRVVYAGSLRDDEDIPLEVQAAVVEALEDFATVRFIDVRSEAIDDTADGEPVIEDGVLVLLGSVPSGPSPSVEAERYIDRRTDQRLWVRLESSNEEWSIVRMDITRSSAMASRAAWS